MKSKKIGKELMSELKIESKKIGEKIDWFKFAKKTPYGWKFLPNKEKQWKLLELIAKRVSKKYQLYTTGQIVDLLSDLVNN